MRKTRRSACARGLMWLGLVSGVLAASSASGQAERPAGDGAPGPFSVRTGLGFAVDPDSFVLAFEGDYAFSRAVSAGVLVELGLDDDLLFVSPVGYGRYTFDLDALTENARLRRLHPYAQLGLGLTHFDRDVSRARRALGVEEEDTELLLNFGFGVEYTVDAHVSVVSQMLFNVIPAEIYGSERFYFSWEVLSVRYRF